MQLPFLSFNRENSWGLPCLFSLLGAGALLTGGCAREPYGPADARVATEARQPLAPGADTVRNVAAGRHYQQHGRFYKAILGEHYRQVWAAPVAAPIFNLATATPGGRPLTFDKAGGGFQSISLSLEDRDGREYALRALDKDPRKTLPNWLQGTFLLNAVRDATSAANPYGALVVPPLAEAAGVVSAHPRLVYVRPDETALGTSSARIRGKLALLEEKYDGKAGLTPALNGASDLVDSEKMLREVYRSPQHQIAGLAFLRARLLDIWLGDWDRHEGQWQWAVYPNKRTGGVEYRAIPKDRDQVFFRFDDGAVPWLVSRRFAVPRFQTFRARYGYMPGLVKQARFIDKRGLMQLTRTDFARTATDLQARWPDTLIERAVRRLPPTVYALEGNRTTAALRQRRDALPAAAAAFYLSLARRPVIGGTAQAERFVVRRYADSVTVVVLSAALRPDSVRFRRTFYPNETSEITLEALAGQDVFDITTADASRAASRVRLVLVGGADTDQVRSTGSLRRVRYYDSATTNASRTNPSTEAGLRARPLLTRRKPYDRTTKN